MISLVDGIALALPVLAYAIGFHFYLLDPVMLCLFGACGFSVSAFVLWMHSQYLANTFLKEREARDRTRLHNIMAELAANESGAPLPHPTGNAGKGEPGGAKTYIGPRSVARVGPVLPAFLSMMSLLAVAGNILLAASVSVHEMLTEQG